MADRCGICNYRKNGDCHKNAPTPRRARADLGALIYDRNKKPKIWWPAVPDDGWCAEGNFNKEDDKPEVWVWPEPVEPVKDPQVIKSVTVKAKPKVKPEVKQVIAAGPSPKVVPKKAPAKKKPVKKSPQSKAVGKPTLKKKR